jgi:predicted DNA binding CopG/RHH family protein
MPKSKEDKEIIRSIEAGEWLPSLNSAVLKKQLRAAAKATTLKDQRMNIRIARKDMLALKAKALEQGMAYQTLVSSLLHKYVTGQLQERKAS